MNLEMEQRPGRHTRTAAYNKLASKTDNNESVHRDGDIERCSEKGCAGRFPSGGRCPFHSGEEPNPGLAAQLRRRPGQSGGSQRQVYDTAGHRWVPVHRAHARLRGVA